MRFSYDGVLSTFCVVFGLGGRDDEVCMYNKPNIKFELQTEVKLNLNALGKNESERETPNRTPLLLNGFHYLHSIYPCNHSMNACIEISSFLFVYYCSQ